jgi:HlyD family secretion protein
MQASIVLGALPDVELRGEVVEIGLRARRQEGASRFDVRIAVADPGPGVVMRAGYSAVAELELARAADVLVIPERVLRYEAGRPHAMVVGPGGRPERRELELGVGDGLLVEVRAGLALGETLIEPQGALR